MISLGNQFQAEGEKPCDTDRNYSVALPAVLCIMNVLATEDSRDTGEKQLDG